MHHLCTSLNCSRSQILGQEVDLVPLCHEGESQEQAKDASKLKFKEKKVKLSDLKDVRFLSPTIIYFLKLQGFIQPVITRDLCRFCRTQKCCHISWKSLCHFHKIHFAKLYQCNAFQISSENIHNIIGGRYKRFVPLMCSYVNYFFKQPINISMNNNYIGNFIL